jgi:aryl-alcohol dehydrogenase-like predicted oxidoreductase
MPFGRTGHLSTRIIFGAAALARMRQDRADRVLALLLDSGIDHIDTASGYGDSELRIRPWMAQHRERFFLASKVRERTASGARAELSRSLERLGVARLDLIQLHNLVAEDEWASALAPGGALEALVLARERGLVRFIGVTGHGTRAPRMHMRSLDRFPFDSVLAPASFAMLEQPEYARDFEALCARCRDEQVAVQTIKAIARRRWEADDTSPRHSWYEPVRDADAIRRAVHFVLARSGLFLNTSSDATLLPVVLSAAAEPIVAPRAVDLADDVARLGIAPLFIPGLDGI